MARPLRRCGRTIVVLETVAGVKICLASAASVKSAARTIVQTEWNEPTARIVIARTMDRVTGSADVKITRALRIGRIATT